MIGLDAELDPSLILKLKDIAAAANRASVLSFGQCMLSSYNLDLWLRDMVSKNCTLLPTSAKAQLRSSPMGSESVFDSAMEDEMARLHDANLTDTPAPAPPKPKTQQGGQPFREGRGAASGQQPRPKKKEKSAKQKAHSWSKKKDKKRANARGDQQGAGKPPGKPAHQ